MYYNIERSDVEIDEVLEKASEWRDNPKNCPFWGMSYAEGIVNTIMWLTGNYDDSPVDE